MGIFYTYNFIQHINAVYSGSHIVTKLDNLIPFIPQFIWPYSLGFLLILAVVLLEDAIYIRFLLSFIVSSLLSLAIFYYFPNEYTMRPVVLESGYTYDLLRFVYRYDLPYNTLPSLHVLYAMLVALAFHHDKSQSELRTAAAWLVCSLVAISTLFVKQHFVMDVLGAIAIAFFANVVAYKRH